MTKHVSHIMRTIWSSLLSIILIGLFAVFLYKQKSELLQLKTIVSEAHFYHIVLGILVTGLYIVFHSVMYRSCLRAINKDLSFIYSVQLFLKRYFVSSFIPTGFTLSQFTFSKELDRHGIAPLESHFASVLYLLIGAAAYVVLLVPTIFVLILTGQLTRPELIASIIIVIGNFVMIFQFVSMFQGKGMAYRLAKKFIPDLPAFLESWQKKTIKTRHLWNAFWFSISVQASGIALLWITFAALNAPGGLFLAIVGYVITMLVLTFSPLFQGIGLVEISLVFALTRFGIPSSVAVASTLLFRLFQLWIPLILGLTLVVRTRTKKILADLPELSLPV